MRIRAFVAVTKLVRSTSMPPTKGRLMVPKSILIRISPSPSPEQLPCRVTHPAAVLVKQASTLALTTGRVVSPANVPELSTWLRVIITSPPLCCTSGRVYADQDKAKQSSKALYGDSVQEPYCPM